MNPEKNQICVKKYLQPVVSSILLFSLLNPALAEKDKHEGHDHGSKAHELHEKDHAHGEPSEANFFNLATPVFNNGSQHGEHEHSEAEKHEHNEGGDSQNHEGSEGHEEPELKLSSDQLNEFSVRLSQAKSGVINQTIELSGEVVVAPERLYHVIPRVAGVVLQVYKHLGDKVNKGDLLATLSSRELAGAKAQYVAAESLYQLANADLKREKHLYSNKVSSKRSYLAAKQVQVEMSIKRKAAKQRLKSLGLTTTLLGSASKDLTLYELRAPSAGVIIEKHAVSGEVLETDSRSFTIADLSKVWVNLTVYQKDLSLVRENQPVTISTRFGLIGKESFASSDVSWISPVLDEATRSATARVIIDNADGHWRPGLFVSAKVGVAQGEADIVVPLSALQTIEGKTIVFVQHEKSEFEPQQVQVGQRDSQQVEILSGLTVGQSYVSENAFVLKAQTQKSSFGHGHSH